MPVKTLHSRFSNFPHGLSCGGTPQKQTRRGAFATPARETTLHASRNARTIYHRQHRSAAHGVQPKRATQASGSFVDPRPHITNLRDDIRHAQVSQRPCLPTTQQRAVRPPRIHPRCGVSLSIPRNRLLKNITKSAHLQDFRRTCLQKLAFPTSSPEHDGHLGVSRSGTPA